MNRGFSSPGTITMPPAEKLESKLGLVENKIEPDAEVIITIVYDNNGYNGRLTAAWGFSCLVKRQQETILFDTGGDGKVLLSNMARLGINPDGIDACLRIIPTISGDQQNPIGALLYLSPRVKRTLFTRLFLFNQQDENFKVAYTDENSMPLAIYQGRLIGPLKIWEIYYPNDLNIPEEYYGEEVLNPDVNEVKPEYT